MFADNLRDGGEGGVVGDREHWSVGGRSDDSLESFLPGNISCLRDS